MKRINFDLIKCQHELAGAKQAIVCLCCAVAAAMLLILAYRFEAMTPVILFSGLGMILLFCAIGTLCVLLPEWRAYRQDREHLRADYGRHVGPHQ